MHTAMPTEATSAHKGEPSPSPTASSAGQLTPALCSRHAVLHELPTEPPAGGDCSTNLSIHVAQRSCVRDACERRAWGWTEKQPSVGSDKQPCSGVPREPLECPQRQSCPLHALGGEISRQSPSTLQRKAKGPQSHCKMLK